MKQTFLKWLKTQIDDDTPNGDLARDFARDNRPAPANNKTAWLNFLYMGRASSYAIEAFERAWEEYSLTHEMN